MIYALLFALAVVVFLIWFWTGVFTRREDERLNETLDEKDKQLKAYYDAIGENRKAVNNLNDPIYKQRMFDEDNSN